MDEAGTWLLYQQVGHLHKSKTGKSKERIKHHREGNLEKPAPRVTGGQRQAPRLAGRFPGSAATGTAPPPTPRQVTGSDCSPSLCCPEQLPTPR